MIIEHKALGMVQSVLGIQGGVMSQLGLRNIVDKRMGAFPQINPEFVVRANPYWIVLAEPMAQSIDRRPGWSGMDAVKSRRMCHLTAA